MDSTLKLKEEILQSTISKLKASLALSLEALGSTKNLASLEEFKAESKWDTRGIEAGYLAGAQQKRVKEIEIEIQTLKLLSENLRDLFEVQIGAIVQTLDKKYFITSQTGGIKVSIDDDIYHIVSISSPIAKKLIEQEIDIEEIL